MRLVRGARRPKTDFFLRAEAFFNLATEVERSASATATARVRCTSSRTGSRSSRS